MAPERVTKRSEKVDNGYLKIMDGEGAMIHLSQPQQSSDWWEEFSKRLSGSPSKTKEPVKFESVFKISMKTFDYICSLVEEDMMALTSRYNDLHGKPLPLYDRVALAIRRLGFGDTLTTVGKLFGISPSSVGHITWQFVESMENRARHHVSWPSTEVELKEIKSKFEKMGGLPNCCGAIDVTHIVMTVPVEEKDVWLDREKNCSMLLQVVVDPEMRLRDVFTGWPGSLADATVLRSAGLFKLCEEGKRLTGENVECARGSELREYLVGDAGFPLLPWLLTPYRGNHLSNMQFEFNKRHYATRLVAERALVMLKDMWRILQGKTWKRDKQKMPRVIFVCCLLHNILIDMEDEVQDEMPLYRYHDLGYRQQVCRSTCPTASSVRDELSVYLFGNSQIPQQLLPWYSEASSSGC